jgi:diaminopimelate epimerase
MNGAGNDFIVIDNRDLSIKLDAQTIEALCDRHRGIGADGLLAVEPAQHGANFRFRYYNADGGEAEMCGNGARCFGRFTAHLGDNIADRVTFETIAGTLAADMVGENVRIAMSEPNDLKLNTPTKVAGLNTAIHFVNTGVPHAVSYLPDADALDAEIAANQASLEASGHCGVPTLVFDGEPFFGQDRIDMAVWRMQQKGLVAR